MLQVGQLTNLTPTKRPTRCSGCPFKSKTCGSKGPIDSPIVFVGESPGQSEIVHNKPFVGRSGEFLDNVVPKEYRHIKPFVTNAFCCLPPKEGKDTVLAEAVSACTQRLLVEIKAYPRKVIIALGNGAMWGLTGEFGHRITQIRGQVFPSELAEHGIVASVHPAYLLRGSGSQRLFKRDIELGYELYVKDGKTKYSYVDADCILMETEGDIRDLIDLASKDDVKYIAGDIETSDLSYFRGSILSQGFCFDPRTAYIVPPRLFKYVGQIYNPEVVKARWIWHNGKFDIGWLRYEKERQEASSSLETFRKLLLHEVTEGSNREGYQFARVDEDTMLLSYAIEETKGIHGLETVASDYLMAPKWKDMKDAYLPKKFASYANIPPNVLYRYQAKDLSSTLQAFHVMRPMVAADPLLEKLYTRTLIPASEHLAWVERCGFKVDRARMKINEKIQNDRVADALSRVNKISQEVLGYEINPGSWQQVQKLLYVGGLGLAGKHVLGTDVKVLNSLTPKNTTQHPAITAILDYRVESKALSTYIIGLYDDIMPDKRIHTSFLIHGTTSGRLSSRDPNLQNIDRDGEIRNQFVCDTEFVPIGSGDLDERLQEAYEEYLLELQLELFELDLNQAELRSLACLSGDEVLCKVYTENKVSIHHIVSCKLFGKDYNQEEYMRSKMVTFGIVYGRGAASLAQEFKISEEEAQKYIDDWFAQFPQAHKFIQRCRQAPLRGAKLITPFGRKRRFGIISPEKAHNAQNQAANFPHQSIASDIMLHGAIEIRPFLQARRIKMVDLVHDCMMLEQRDDEDLRQEVKRVGKAILEAIPPRWGLKKVPFIADAKRGKRWGDFKKD